MHVSRQSLSVKQKVLRHDVQGQTRTPVRNWAVRLRVGTWFLLLWILDNNGIKSRPSLDRHTPHCKIPRRVILTCGSSCPVIRLISGGLGSMYVVSCVTKCTWCGSCHGFIPAWCRNTMAYSVPFFRVFLGKDTFTNLSNLLLTSKSSSLWIRMCPLSAFGFNAV